MSASFSGIAPIYTAWAVLHEGLSQMRPVQGDYHDRHRVLCPHALGWKNGRAKVLAYQIAVIGAHHRDPVGWRSFFVDEFVELRLTDDAWRSAPNFTPHTAAMDAVAACVRPLY